MSGWSAILFVFSIFFFVFREAAPILPKLRFREFFTSSRWYPVSDPPSYGILGLLVGTLSVTTLSTLLAVPLGLGSAVYLSEFCGRRTREWLKIVIELLAAIPSVVWGFVAYLIISPLIMYLTGSHLGVNILNAGIVLALMSVPVIVSVVVPVPGVAVCLVGVGVVVRGGIVVVDAVGVLVRMVVDERAVAVCVRVHGGGGSEAPLLVG